MNNIHLERAKELFKTDDPSESEYAFAKRLNYIELYGSSVPPAVVPDRYQIEPTGKLGTRFTLSIVGPAGDKWKLGSIDVPDEGDLSTLYDMLTYANTQWRTVMREALPMHVYNIKLRLGSDAIEHLTNYQHVSPAVMERMLKDALEKVLDDFGVDVLEVEHVDDVLMQSFAFPTKMELDDVCVSPVNPQPKHKPNYRPLVMVRDNGKRLYVDEFVTLEGNAWELAMDQYGHDVTAHINENGDCPRCQFVLTGERTDPPENVPTFEFIEDKPDPREYIGFSDAYSLGHSHGARNIHDKAIPITPYQWRKMYRDDDGQLFSYYKKGYNNYMGENDFNDVHDYETDLGLAAEELLSEPTEEKE